MTATLRTVTTGTALLLVNMASAAGRITAGAIYVGDGSFDLPPAGPTSPRDPAAIGVAPNGALHIVDQRGQVMVFDAAVPARLRDTLSNRLDELGSVCL